MAEEKPDSVAGVAQERRIMSDLRTVTRILILTDIIIEEVEKLPNEETRNEIINGLKERFSLGNL